MEVILTTHLAFLLPAFNPMPSFHKPYLHVPETMRVQTQIPTKDYQYLFREILFERGSQKALLAHLISDLVLELQPLKLVPYDPRNESLIVSHLRTRGTRAVGK